MCRWLARERPWGQSADGGWSPSDVAVATRKEDDAEEAGSDQGANPMWSLRNGWPQRARARAVAGSEERVDG